MNSTKEMTIIPVMKVFNTNIFNLDLKEDILLNSINIYTVNDSSLGVSVPFDIQNISKSEIRIVPRSTHNKFMIKYNRLVIATKIEIKAEDMPKYKFDNNTYTFYFDYKGNLLN